MFFHDRKGRSLEWVVGGLERLLGRPLRLCHGGHCRRVWLVGDAAEWGARTGCVLVLGAGDRRPRLVDPARYDEIVLEEE